MTPAEIARGARISECGLYRYDLVRRWQDHGMPARGDMLFVMLNPSTADASVDDPTIRRCMHFARREGCDGLRVVNLFAFRATDPAALKRIRDPVGPDNDRTLRAAFAEQRDAKTPCVAAWGAHGTLHGRHLRVLAIAREVGVEMVCLGRTKHAAPKHPLYMSNDSPLVVWP